MQAQVERQYDEYERMAIEAIMRENAHRSKKTKVSNLFKRPVSDEEARDKLENAEERMRSRIDRLSKFKEFQGKFNEL